MNWFLENTYSSLPEVFYTHTEPTPVKKPSLTLFNYDLANELGLGDFNEDTDLNILSGNLLAPKSKPLAQAYSGHQFGYYTVLGDGRAHLLGEILSPDKKRYDIQLKGSGPTPFSRSGDGRASLGPMLREYIISEAMNSLSVPTTRSLSVVETGEHVYREQALPGAVLTRVAKSHIRVGTFEYASSLNDLSILKKLMDYTIKRHYSDAKSAEEFLAMVCTSQAKLISKWMGLGFIHGVMNTDNMSICGETIDYGPCAFMDEYNPLQAFSFIDKNRRYAFGRQPKIALWNLTRLAETLLPIIDDDLETSKKKAEEILSQFSEIFKTEWLNVMSKKLGITNADQNDQLECAQNLLNLMEQHESDFTNTFRALSENQALKNSLFESEDFKSWHKKWLKTIEPECSYKTMLNANPSIIPRNHLVEEALSDSLNGSYKKLHRLLKAIKKPFLNNSKFDDLKNLPTDSQRVQHTFCGT